MAMWRVGWLGRGTGGEVEGLVAKLEGGVAK